MQLQQRRFPVCTQSEIKADAATVLVIFEVVRHMARTHLSFERSEKCLTVIVRLDCAVRTARTVRVTYLLYNIDIVTNAGKW